MRVSKIGGSGGPPSRPTDVQRPNEAAETAQTRDVKAQKPAGAPASATPAGATGTTATAVSNDRFERATAQVGSQLATQLNTIKGPAGKVQFTNEDYQYLAQTFAAI